MSKFSFSFTLTVIVILCIKNSNGFEESTEFEYDILTLTQSWPETSCWYLNPNKTGVGGDCSPCKMPNDEISWTLHGLWPTSLHGKHPSFCSKIPYDPKLINSTLRAKMIEEWPTYDLKGSDDAFWEHEWQKHGTCTTNLESTNTMPKYFAKSLEMLDQYNAGRMFAKVGLSPGELYDVDKIYQEITRVLKVYVYIACVKIHRSDEKEQYLYQIEMCFNKSFELVDCGRNIQATCDRRRQVMFPRNEKSCPLIHNNV